MHEPEKAEGASFLRLRQEETYYTFSHSPVPNQRLHAVLNERELAREAAASPPEAVAQPNLKR